MENSNRIQKPLLLNDELIKYYDGLIKKINEDFDNKKYLDAINRCKEELEQPYLPFEYINVFENLYHELETKYRHLQIDYNLKSLTQSEMLHKIFDGNTFNVYLYDYFLETYHTNINKEDFIVIQSWLASSKILNTQKFYILDGLAHFKIDHNFIYYNTNTNDDVVLNTIKFHDNNGFKQYNDVLEKIDIELEKDPIVAKFATDLLDAVAEYYFPTFPFASVERLSEIILKIIFTSMRFMLLQPEKMDDDERKVYNIFMQFQNFDI